MNLIRGLANVAFDNAYETQVAGAQQSYQGWIVRLSETDLIIANQNPAVSTPTYYSLWDFDTIESLALVGDLVAYVDVQDNAAYAVRSYMELVLVDPAAYGVDLGATADEVRYCDRHVFKKFPSTHWVRFSVETYRRPIAPLTLTMLGSL